MDTYTVVKNRIFDYLGEKEMAINKLAVLSAVTASSIKNILYGKSENSGIVTIKMLCDGLDISFTELLIVVDFGLIFKKIKANRLTPSLNCDIL